MPENPYDEVPYFTAPSADNHPDRLATVATLFGMKPAPLNGCRVLEIGCGDGSNLIPMASRLPGSRFTGVDLAAGPIAKGQRTIDDLGLANINLIAADLRELAPDAGTFDYIIAHGVYSWVPVEVRDGLMALCAERLTPQGVAYISYNTYPGRHVRKMLGDMLVHLTRKIEDPTNRVEAARSLLVKLRDKRLSPASWRNMLESEVEALLKRRPTTVWHDDFSPVSDPVYFHEFAAQATANGLQYLGDAELHVMSDLRAVDDAPAGDIIEREQYLDFLLCRRFRETLLCGQKVALDRKLYPGMMRQFHFAAPCRVLEDGAIEGLHGMRISPGQPALERIAAALGDSYPLPLPFEELIPYAGESDLSKILFAFVSNGFAMLHVHDFPCEETVTVRPKADRLVRYQARNSSTVCGASHVNVQLDEAGRRIVLLLDGTRDHEEIALALAAALGSPVDQVREHLPQSLAWMARTGLLEG
jgi:methyltransferase-like protein/ubiquinone/menaquinone biosynthesis C-methylase UbiE